LVKLTTPISGRPPLRARGLPRNQENSVRQDDNQTPPKIDNAYFALLSLLAYEEKKARIYFKNNTSFQSFDAPGDLKAFAVKIDNHAFISFRGTVSWANWKIDLCAFVTGSPLRHKGFQLAWESLRPAVDTWLSSHTPSTVSFTGHSLGSALATLAAFDLAQSWLVDDLGKAPKEPRYIIGYVVGFGSPRVGLGSFVQKYRSLKTGPDPSVTLANRTARFVMATDLVARVPPPFFYEHVVSESPLGYPPPPRFGGGWSLNTVSKLPWYLRIFSHRGPFSQGSGADAPNIGLIYLILDPTTWFWFKLPLFASLAGFAFAQDASYHACRRYRDAFKPPRFRAADWIDRKKQSDRLFAAAKKNAKL